MTDRIIVHMIGQAHIDPIWLWPWQAGLDEVLATCRTACNLLDEYDDFIFTRGEAWSYQQIERLDPELFSRIKAHVAAGRWEIVGGWWIQPDCNQPSGFGFEHQIGIGKDYFLDRFGTFPEIGYNVDSFGHAATLPGYMRAAGQRFYVMMRPQEHEMALPARLFRWRGYADGPEVTTFRIAAAYTTGMSLPSEWHIRQSMSELPAGVQHTMCFYGVGDHGGGPTAESIRWIQEHRNALDGCELIFSSPARFFNAITENIQALPVVTGELQHHAIGCYSVQRAIKTAVRQAEHQLHQAEVLLGENATPEEQQSLHQGWERVCFNQFHDTLGGTCLPSAYPQALHQLGQASAIADDFLQYGVRKKMLALPDDPLQRIILFNASDSPFSGYTEFEPWTQWQQWPADGQLLDENGTAIPFQLITSESAGPSIPRVLTHLDVAPNAMRVLRIQPNGDGQAFPQRASVQLDTLTNDLGVTLTLGANGGICFPGEVSLPLPRLDLIEDRTDNWSHGIDRYLDGPVESPVWNAPFILHQGTCLGGFGQTGTLAKSQLRAEWRVYAGEPFVELLLTIHWMEKGRLLKLTLPMPDKTISREDGIAGGSLVRQNDGKERPLRDWTQLTLANGKQLGVVCPDVYAIDATPERARFTLLRSVVLTHHDPHSGMTPNAVISDQGVHHFRFRFYGGEYVETQVLDTQALMYQRPLLDADLTKGMPCRYRVS